MKILRTVCLLGYGILCLGVVANAQSWDRDRYYPNTPYRADQYYNNRGFLIDRVMSDLNAAGERARLDGHEIKHFNEVADNLQEFRARWARGKFDTGKLDRAIHNLEHLAEADRLRGRDREILSRDLYDLRQFRDSRGAYGRYPTYDPRWR